MIRRMILPFLLVALSTAAALAAEGEKPLDVAAILSKLAQARGGNARWDAVKTLRIEGAWTAFSEVTPMTIRRKRPDLYRFDHQVLKTPAVVAWDGEQVWVQGEAYGAPTGQELEDDWKRNVVDEIAFDPPLLAYAASGAKIELRGSEPLDGRKAWVLDVSRAGMPDETWYVDAETFLEQKRVSKTFDLFSGPDIELEMETYYMDFRPVGGLVLPFREERHFGVRYLVYEARTIEVDPELDAAVFRKPPPPKQEPEKEEQEGGGGA